MLLSSSSPQLTTNRNQILTGATGALGAHLLDGLRNHSTVDQIICLVRAVDHFTARSRISASLVKRRKPALEVADDKVWCSPCKFSDPTGNLGVSDMELSHIRQNATHIIHVSRYLHFSPMFLIFLGGMGSELLTAFEIFCG